MPVRRRADPTCVQHVWDAIRYTEQKSQPTDLFRLSKYLQRVCELTANQAENYLRRVLCDNLLESVKKTSGGKGVKSPVNNSEYFKIPSTDDNMPVDDGHDWYCIECHLAGDVIYCRTCHRVFHSECGANAQPKIITSHSDKQSNPPNISSSNNSDIIIIDPDTSSSSKDDKIDNDEICSVCKMYQNEKPGSIEKDELNYLLHFTLNRIRIWLPANITDVMGPRIASEWMTEQEIGWRVRHLLYQPMDTKLMEMKIRTKEYTRLAEFHADAITIQHNVAIYHGLQSQEMQGSDLMLTDSKYDLVEIRQCVDCYRHSNEKRNEFWFCIPCRPPHELVWAKQKGYPHWPAKVIRITDEGQYDVRFFGAKHLRAVVDKNSIKPIDVNITKLQVKRTQAFNKAMQELTEYQRLLQRPDEVTEIMMHTPEINFKSPVNKNKQKQKKSRTSDIDADQSDIYIPNNDQLDIYGFNDDLLTIEPSPPVMEKKKRGRKSGTLQNKNSLVKKFDSPKDRKKNQLNKYEHIDHVSSSTENISYKQPILSIEDGETIASRSRSGSGSGSSSGTQQLERVYSDPVENLRRQMEQMPDKEAMIKLSLETMQNEIDRCMNVHSDHIRSLVDAHNVFISENKKKQWCFNCEQEAIYHCCWNTAYCSTTCQQQHWQAEHKKVCRRKR